MIPYTPKIHRMAGTYRMEVGDLFYIGSSKKVGGRFSNHRTMLENGEHWVKELQAAYDAGGEVRFFLIREIPEKPCDVKNKRGDDHRSRLWFWEQQLLDPLYGTPGCVNRSSSSCHNSKVSEMMRKKWADPEWRGSVGAKISESLRGREISKETRTKMSEAKKGARNAKSKPVIMWFEGERHEFPSAMGAAERFGVKQQVMDLWLRGVVPWPGRGVGKTRYPNLIGLYGSFSADEGMECG